MSGRGPQVVARRLGDPVGFWPDLYHRQLQLAQGVAGLEQELAQLGALGGSAPQPGVQGGQVVSTSPDTGTSGSATGSRGGC